MLEWIDASGLRLATVHQRPEIALLCLRQRVRLPFRGRCRLTEIRRGDPYVVGFRIERHRLRPVLGHEHLDRGELVGRVFMVNMDPAFASRDKDHARVRLESNRIDTDADGGHRTAE